LHALGTHRGRHREHRGARRFRGDGVHSTHLALARGFAISHAGLSLVAFAAGGIVFAVFARPVLRHLGEVGLAIAGTLFLGSGLALVAWTPAPAVAPWACLLAGLGFYMLHNTLQTNATQMAPAHRGAGMALFASMYYLGQSVGVAIAGLVAQFSTPVWVLLGAAVAILPVGLNFARLKRPHTAS